MCLLGAVASAVGDGELDLLQGAAPQPFVVIEVGIARPPSGTGAVALHTIDREGGPSAGEREFQQLGITANVLERGRLDTFGELRAVGLRLGDIVEEPRAVRRAQDTLGVAADQRPGRHGDPIADRPHNGGVEDPLPPIGQWRIELANAVPFVTGGLLFGVGRSHHRSSFSGIWAASSNFFFDPGRSA